MQRRRSNETAYCCRIVVFEVNYGAGQRACRGRLPATMKLALALSIFVRPARGWNRSARARIYRCWYG